LWIDTKGEHP